MSHLRSLSLPALVALACGLFAGIVTGQDARKPLNLKLPAGTAASVQAPASATSSAAPAVTARSLPALPAGADEFPPPARSADASAENAPATPTPGVYYGDHSNTTAAGYAEQTTPDCDDYTYNKPQVHGSVGTGIVTGNHIGTGSVSGGVATLSKAFGSCDHPEGGVSISVGGTTSHGFERRR